MTDIEGKRVLDIAKDRKAESIDKLFNTLTEYQSNGIEAVSMDSEAVYYRSRQTYTACRYRS